MINVSCAIIVNKKNEVLVTQRSLLMKWPLKWEFPGGKIEKDETAEECLKREIKEELCLEINIKHALDQFLHRYEDFTVNLIPFICEIKSGEIELTQHADYLWLMPNKLFDLDWAEADIPVISRYLNYITD